MKHLIAIALTMCATLTGIADSGKTTPSKWSPKPIALKPIPKPTTRPNRMPGQPIYGEYSNQALYIFVDEMENDNYTLSISKDNIIVENAIVSTQDLYDGYSVSVATPFSVELTLGNGTSYIGEVE